MGTTYPISPKDIIDILPTVKHSGIGDSSSISCINGFTPCTFNSTTTTTTTTTTTSSLATTLHILLPDAIEKQKEASIQYHKHKNLTKALDAIQESASLYQRVIDNNVVNSIVTCTSPHVNIAYCLHLTAMILFAANELDIAAGNAARCLALYVQLFGPDCMEVVTCHTTLAHILLTSSSSSSSSTNA